MRVKEEVLVEEVLVTVQVVAPVVVAVMTLPIERSMVALPVVLPKALTVSDQPRISALVRPALPRSSLVAESLIATLKYRLWGEEWVDYSRYKEL